MRFAAPFRPDPFRPAPAGPLSHCRDELVVIADRRRSVDRVADLGAAARRRRRPRQRRIGGR